MLDFSPGAHYPVLGLSDQELTQLVGIGSLFLWEGCITTISEEALVKVGGMVQLAAVVRELAADVHATLMFYTLVPPCGGSNGLIRTQQEVMNEAYVALGRAYAERVMEFNGQGLPTRRWWLKLVRDTLSIFMDGL